MASTSRAALPCLSGSILFLETRGIVWLCGWERGNLLTAGWENLELRTGNGGLLGGDEQLIGTRLVYRKSLALRWPQ
ncbi:hypothetical protein RRG08_050163 [Elysia crispata]|uniref:Uncharacterized protein n=1 Tax=Elysia crispata TaxID=231223 RepID=A0AAE0YDK6_9GAST|nr:hypothetical protein RRG08_050163 [Elysia crispata]